jgi:hypothetical protein
MQRSKLTISDTDLSDAWPTMVRGRVLHVSCASNIDSILRHGILPNTEGGLATSFGSSSSSFFRLRGCVSVFDYRAVSDEHFESSWRACSPATALHQCNDRVALFVLRPEACDTLESWQLWKSTESYSQMVVPHVEAGHPGPIPIESIEELIELAVVRTPSPIADALRQARLRAKPEA